MIFDAMLERILRQETEGIFLQNFELGREGNRITIAGPLTFHDVRKVKAVLHKAIADSGYADIHLDFSRCISAFSAGMLPICAHVLYLTEKRIDFQVTLPDADRLRRLFINSGWAHLLCPREYDPGILSHRSRHIPAIRYRTSEEQNEAINQILEKLLETIPDFNRSAFTAVEWALNEITDNVINHSSSSIGGILQLSNLENTKKLVEITISDAGDGVPHTLRLARSEIESDADALMMAVRSGVTRNPVEFQGNGLYGSLEMCRVAGGRFSLSSGYAALLLSRGALTARNEAVPFSGTTVDMTIDFSQPALLEKALSIDGRIHTPVDYIETNYEQDGLTSIPFKLNDKGYSFRSRPAGKPIKNKLSNLISACPGQKIVIDFSGIPVVSSSFADEVFGKLFAELGPMRFMQSVSMVNITSTVQALIDRAITQRMKLPE